LNVNENLMTPAEVAKLLRVSLRSVYRWVNRGQLAAQHLPGGGLRIEREDALAMLTPAGQERPKHRAGAKRPAARERRTREILDAAGLV
jgi:excisionase family DNA binding protein